jgi:S1-C subfamily serine protease
MRRRLAREKVDCIHCHTIGDMEREEAAEEGRWKPWMVWRHPDPIRLGLVLEDDEQAVIAEVTPGSPAAAAGLAPGDRLLRIGDGGVRSEADIRFALDRVPFAGGRIGIAIARGSDHKSLAVEVRDGWRAGSPLELAWRNEMWSMRPNPGFGGPALSKEEKAALGLTPDRFAMKVGYLIDFGTHPEDGRNAKAAGLRKGDVVFRIDGTDDFLTERHFQAWWRLTRKPGSTATLSVLRLGKHMELRLPVLP